MSLDRELASSNGVHFVSRLVDDYITVHDPACCLISAIANAWHSNIRVDLAACGQSNIPYLDVCVSLSGSSCTFELYRKPGNTYGYVPRSSCHRAQVFRSIVLGECRRIYRRCTFPCDQAKHLDFFCKCLSQRGYSYSEIYGSFALAKEKSSASTPCDERVQSCNAFLKFCHSSSVNYHYINNWLRRFSSLMPFNCKVICATTSQKNVFRLLYPVTWSKLAVGG